MIFTLLLLLVVLAVGLLVFAIAAPREPRPLSITPAHVYNAVNLTGVLLAAVGTGVEYGAGYGLMVAGSLVLLMTIYTAERMTRRAG